MIEVKINRNAVKLAICQIIVCVGSTQSFAHGNKGHQPGQAGKSISDQVTSQFRSEEIKSVQTKLKQKGYDVGSADGVMGQKTIQAIRQYQKENNQPVTGNLDPVTLAQLGVSGRGQTKSQAGIVPQDRIQTQEDQKSDTPTRDSNQ